jgi:hypothetical protein
VNVLIVTLYEMMVVESDDQVKKDVEARMR